MVANPKTKIVVIGGGTGGISVASRLADTCDVTIIEKSFTSSPNLFSRIPLAIGLAFQDPRQTYISCNTLEASAERSIPLFTSRLLGGASVINGCVHTIGGYDLWLPTLRAHNISDSEFTTAVQQAYGEGQADSLRLRQARRSQVDECFESAALAAGIPRDDTSKQDNSAVGKIVNTCGRFLRSSVLDLIKKKRIKLLLGQIVVGFDISSEGKVRSVETDKGDKIYGDVFILAGGVEGSCEILKRVNERYNERFFCNSTLGKGIADHINVRINVKSKLAYGSINEIWGNNLRRVGLLARHLAGWDTIMSGTGATTALNLDLDDDGTVDTRINLLAFSEDGRHGQQGGFLSEPGFSLSISSINPESRGTLLWRSGKKVVSPNYLTVEKDRDLAKAGVLAGLNFLESESMKGVVGEIINLQKIRNETDRYVQSTFFSGHHLIGGANKIVKSDFMVGETHNMYICDASILSSFPASNIHAPIVILGIILGNRLKAKLCS